MSFNNILNPLIFSLGMYHDSTRGCTGSDVGLMGGYGAGWSSCSVNDLNVFLQYVII